MDKKVDIIKVLRVPPDGHFAIEVGNRPIETIDPLTKNPQAHKIVLSAIARLVEFAGGYEELVKAGLAPDLTPPPPTPAVVQPPKPTPTLAEEQLLASILPPPPPASKPAGGLRSFFQRGTPAKKEPELPTLNVAAELNAFLQKQIAQMPELANTKIKVESDSYGGVQINVNGQIYEEAAQIPDPMVRMAFKMATKEWESQR